MEISVDSAWVFYINETENTTLDDNRVGKWMYFFSDRTVAEKVCREAVLKGIVPEAKHSNDDTGVCCFYLLSDDISTHKAILEYMIQNNLIRKTKAGKLYNISFKLDSQTDANLYGDAFVSDIKLSSFVDLFSGEWIYPD